MRLKRIWIFAAAWLALGASCAAADETHGRKTTMDEKIVQTAGRQALGEFAPMFAHLNDDVLFGEVWN